MATLWQDIRYGVRIVTRAPWFAALAVSILALGIGANAAMFSLVSALLLRPLPYRSPERLVMILSTAVGQGLPISRTAPPDYRAWRAESHLFEDVAAFTQS